MSILFTLNTTAPSRRTEPPTKGRFSHTQSTLSYQQVLFISSNIAALPTTTLIQAPPSDISASFTIIFSLYHFIRFCVCVLRCRRAAQCSLTMRGKSGKYFSISLACWENTIAQVCKRSRRAKCLHNIFIHA